MSIKSPTERLNWLCSMRGDKSIHESAFRVALHLASCCNKDSAQCNPEEITIQRATGIVGRSVERAVAALRDCGYVRIFKNGKLNNYILLIPDRQEHPTQESGKNIPHPTQLSETPDTAVGNTRHRSRIEQGIEQGIEQCGAPSVTQAGKPARCPHQEIVEIYHKTLPILPAVRLLTENRKRLLRTRWKEDPERQSLDWWTKYFEYVADSDFLTGKTNGTGDRPPFVADFEWLIKPSNFVKVIEGKYHRGAA